MQSGTAVATDCTTELGQISTIKNMGQTLHRFRQCVVAASLQILSRHNLNVNLAVTSTTAGLGLGSSEGSCALTPKANNAAHKEMPSFVDVMRLKIFMASSPININQNN
jgi:hypothetical protein